MRAIQREIRKTREVVREVFGEGRRQVPNRVNLFSTMVVRKSRSPTLNAGSILRARRAFLIFPVRLEGPVVWSGNSRPWSMHPNA